jgi:transposase-like protein
MARKGRRRYFKAAEKVAILKRHLVEREEVSAICEDLKIHPNQFYEWQKLFFENGVKAFESLENREEEVLRTKVSALESKLQRKDAVLSELMEAHLALKKNFGEI